MKHFLSVLDLTKKELLELIKKSREIKRNPKRYHKKLYEKILLTFFAAPSLRTEVSFDAAMFTMGGEVVDYHADSSPWKKGKESITDMAKVLSRYCDVIMIRLHDHKGVLKLAKNASIPVINGLTEVEHPCQAIADMMTILEKKKTFKGLNFVYLGDANNNVTHSLLYACALLGVNMTICCPKSKEFSPSPAIVRKAKAVAKRSRSIIEITSDVPSGVENADVVCTDSWMSYHISATEKKRRLKILKPFQVNKKVMNLAKKNAIFMHCLPAKRGQEVTRDVIDGKQSVVFDEAENRLHTEKALLLKLVK